MAGGNVCGGPAGRAPRRSAGNLSEASAASRARRPVLLIDDPSWNRSEAAETLLEVGILPLTEPSAEHALALAASEMRLDAVVLPANPRGMAVDELIRSLRVRRPRVPLLVVGAAAEIPPPTSPAEGPVVCLEDAADAEKLCEALRTWLGIQPPTPDVSLRRRASPRPVGP